LVGLFAAPANTIGKTATSRVWALEIGWMPVDLVSGAPHTRASQQLQHWIDALHRHPPNGHAAAGQ
jgi:hypothetical protein